MSNKKVVALVSVTNVMAHVRRHVTLDDDLTARVVRTKKIPLEEARDHVLRSSTTIALRYSGGDERKAGMALIITNGRPNRLPQCAKLLRIFPDRVVRTAYEIKDELSYSNASLRLLCKLVSHTDQDVEGEATRVRAMLDELVMGTQSPRDEIRLFRRVLREVESGHLIESVVQGILGELEETNKAQNEEDEVRNEIYNRVFERDKPKTRKKKQGVS